MDIEITPASALTWLQIVVAALVFSVLAVTLMRRFTWGASAALGTAALLAAIVQGSRTWMAEPPDVHWGNQELNRVSDWVVHVGMAGAMLALPALVAIALAAALRRTRSRVGTQIAVTTVATLAGVGMGISLMLVIAAQVYRDGP